MVLLLVAQLGGVCGDECLSNATARANIEAKFKGLVEMLARYDNGKRRNATAATTRLAYFKSHKTGSSTMEAMMINFARKHDLVPVNTVVDYNEHVAEHLGCLDKLRGQPATRGAFDIEFRHFIGSMTSLNKVHGECYEESNAFHRVVETYEWLIDGPGTPIVTTWREPLPQFLSSFGYYNFRSERKTESYEDALVEYVNKSDAAVLNIAARDYQFNATPAGAAAFVAEFLQSDRLLAVVLERLIESLVVMRRLLGWDLADVLHLHINEAGVSRGQRGTEVEVTDQALMNKTTGRITALQKDVDVVVYRAAVAQLDRRVAAVLAAEESQGDLANCSIRGKGEDSAPRCCAPPCFVQETADLQWAVDAVAILCGCSDFLESKELAAYCNKTNKAGFDLITFCDSFVSAEQDREISLTREHNAELQGARLRAQLGDEVMKALSGRAGPADMLLVRMSRLDTIASATPGHDRALSHSHSQRPVLQMPS